MKKFLACTALSVFLLSGCSLFKSEGIIKVNDTVITKAEFEKTLDKEINNSVFKQFGGASNFIKSDDNVMYVIFKDKVVNELIVKSLIDAEIAKRGIEISDDDIKSEMKTIIDKVGSKDELNRLLKERGISNADFTEDLKNQIRIKKLVASLSSIKISDNEAEKYYNSHKAEFTHGEKVRASHILISADTLQLIKTIKAKNKNIDSEELNRRIDEIKSSQKAKAEKILAEVKANPDKFEQIAQKESEDKMSGERGGELGFFSKEDMVPEFSKAAFALKPNTITENLVVTPYGFHIIKVTDRIEPGTTPFVKVKEEIKFFLETQEQLKILKNLTTGLMKTAKIEYIDPSYKPTTEVSKKALEGLKD